MRYEFIRRRIVPLTAVTAVLLLLVLPVLFHQSLEGAQRGAQGASAATPPPIPEAGAGAPPPQAARGGPPPTAKAAAPFDITGTWVSLITDDYEYRMVTPAKLGPRDNADFLPANPAGLAVARAWDPDKDTAAGQQCKGYGAGGVMRLPQRARFSWQDDNTLKLELDNGTQTRLFHFGVAGQGLGGVLTQAQKGQASLQGYSLATWEGGGARGQARGGPPRGAMKVVTSNLTPGYLRKNGVPYSENTTMTEWFNILEDKGTLYLAIQSQVEDPVYLTGPFFRTFQYKKEPNDSKFMPTPCSAK